MPYLEKIKKLLRLARDSSATPAEAAAALSAAMELINRHKVDIAALDLDQPTEALVRDNIDCGARISEIRRRISSLLEEHFHVRICHVSFYDIHQFRRVKSIAVLGRETDVQIARYVFDFLLGAHARSQSNWAKSEKKARRIINAKKKAAYTVGWIYGVASHLRTPADRPALADSRSAIVLAQQSKELDDWFDKVFPNATTPKRKKQTLPTNAMMQGVHDGKKTTIHEPLAPTQQTLALQG